MEQKWRRTHKQKRKTIDNKGDLRIYEIRYRGINACFISQYSSINLNITHISELFRYINPCIYIYFHGELVRNWCGVWEVDIWKRVHHDRLFNKICKEINTVSQLLSCKLTYTHVGDYYIPNIALPEENRPIGRWGRLHRDYLEKHHPILFNDLVLSGQLWTYLADLNEQAQERLFLIVEQMKTAEGVSEELKAANQMAWVGAMNSIRNRAEEIILREMIYGEDAV